MGQPSSKDEMTVRHQFDRLCQMALKGEAVNYYNLISCLMRLIHMDIEIRYLTENHRYK